MSYQTTEHLKYMIPSLKPSGGSIMWCGSGSFPAAGPRQVLMVDQSLVKYMVCEYLDLRPVQDAPS